MKKLSLTVLAIGAAALVLPAPAQAQGLFGDLVRRAKQEAERKAREELQRRVTGTPSSSSGSPSSSYPSSSGAPSSGGFAGSSVGPSATTMIGSVPQRLSIESLTFWQQRGGVKFAGQGPTDLIATNPYLSPGNPLFAGLDGVDCAADGSVIVSGDGWANGDFSGEGWWRVAADGTITPLATEAFERRSQPLTGKFGVTSDGSLVSAYREAIYRVTPGGGFQRIAGMTGTPGYADGPATAARFKTPGAPLQDPQGNVWVVDAGGRDENQACALRRIGPDGMVSTVIGPDRSGCRNATPAPQRVMMNAIAWDAANGELVTAGIATQLTDSDLHTSIWRVKPDGQARRVYYNVKAGRSPAGGNVDGIYQIAVDRLGRISVLGATIPNGNVNRRIMRLNESTGRLVSITGQGAAARSTRAYPLDGPAAAADIHTNVTNNKAGASMCFAPDGTLFFIDASLLRRLNTDGTVRTWAY